MSEFGDKVVEPNGPVLGYWRITDEIAADLGWDDERCPGSGTRPSAGHRRVCADQPALCPICDEPFDVDTTVIPEHE